jgi:hypothetical protein
MNRALEWVVCAIRRESLLHKVEKRLDEGEVFLYEVPLKKGVEYVLRAKLAEGRGTVRLDLLNCVGRPGPSWVEGRKTVYFAKPEEDGLYRASVAVRSITGGRGAGNVSVTLSSLGLFRDMQPLQPQ